MKKFKKAIMGVTALVMAFSMTALAACANGNKDPKDPSDPSNPNGPSEGTLVSPAKTDTVKVMERIQTQSFKAASMQYVLDTKSMTTGYDSDSEGKILDGATKTTSGVHAKMSDSVKINVKDLELDAMSYYFEEALDGEGKKVADATEMETYSYMFARGGHLFSAYDKGKQITDFSDAKIEYMGDMGLPEQLKTMLAALPENGMPAQELTPLTAVLNLAETYGGATFSDKKLTVNFNKTAYGLYNDVLAVIDALNEDTKVGDVIKAKPVKALIESLTYGVSAKDILEQVAAMAGGEAGASTLDGESEGASSEAMIGAILEILPEATAGESVYDYLVRLLESKDVAEAVFKMIAPSLPASAVAPIAEFKVIELLQLFAASMQPPQNPDQGTTMSAAVYEESAGGMQQVTMAQIKQQVKGYLNQMVSVTEDKVTVTMPESAYEVSALEIVYTVGDDYA
ncbi:MAG: hypothetical protein K2O62_06090, partial [Clostridia bacterium]|nr:hypothetical protein [Clostridia bacterium]